MYIWDRSGVNRERRAPDLGGTRLSSAGRITDATGYDPRTVAGLLELFCVIDTIEDAQGDHNDPGVAA